MLTKPILYAPAALAAALCFAPTDTFAGQGKNKSAMPQVRGVAATAEETEARVDKLMTELSWQKSLDQAKTLAQHDGKLILWAHVLGELDGTT